MGERRAGVVERVEGIRDGRGIILIGKGMIGGMAVGDAKYREMEKWNGRGTKGETKV